MKYESVMESAKLKTVLKEEAVNKLSKNRESKLQADHPNTFQTNFPFIYPLKISQNHRFSDVFRRYKKGILT